MRIAARMSSRYLATRKRRFVICPACVTPVVSKSTGAPGTVETISIERALAPPCASTSG
jgi:hypothetical protein